MQYPEGWTFNRSAMLICCAFVSAIAANSAAAQSSQGDAYYITEIDALKLPEPEGRLRVHNLEWTLERSRVASGAGRPNLTDFSVDMSASTLSPALISQFLRGGVIGKLVIEVIRKTGAGGELTVSAYELMDVSIDGISALPPDSQGRRFERFRFSPAKLKRSDWGIDRFGNRSPPISTCLEFRKGLEC